LTQPRKPDPIAYAGNHTPADWAEKIGTDLFREVSVGRRVENRAGAPQEVPKDLKGLSQEAMGHFQRALGLTQDDERRFHLLAKCAEAALEGLPDSDWR